MGVGAIESRLFFYIAPLFSGFHETRVRVNIVDRAVLVAKLSLSSSVPVLPNRPNWFAGLRGVRRLILAQQALEQTRWHLLQRNHFSRLCSC
jgi:hypothetical protein